MCGIFGVISHKNNSIPDKHLLQETARLLNHRGPDSHGIYADIGIGLVHTRLSLVDLSTNSNQPFWDKQRRYCLIYNGEIYNFKELRAELEKRGVEFRTTSDTEVLLECIVNCGVEATLPRVEGMFAFALYDTAEKTLVLARDRFGMKPLFIYDKDDTFMFASEIQAMRLWLDFKPDVLSISSFLQGFDGPTQGYSFFENIKFIPPGTLVKIRIGKPAQYSQFFSMSRFWNQDWAKELKQLKPQQLVDEVERLLLESVKKQMFADAPVGALCSGGVDSSLIMAMATQFHNHLAIFHANVVGRNSEYEAAARLAKHLKLDLKTVEVHDKDFIALLPDVIEHYGHPFYHTPHSIPFLMVSRLVRLSNVKAVLSGEGSDECFLGYGGLAPNIKNWRQYLKKRLKRLVETGAKPQSGKLIEGLHNRFEIAFEAKEARRLIEGKGTQEVKIDDGLLKSLDLLHYNLRALLHRNDSMGMAASIESRFPFLDSELVKLAINMPYSAKIRFSPTAWDENHPFFIDKWVLRQVADRYLPRELSQRAKKPFPVDAFRRFRIAPTFFEKSFVLDLFGLSSQEMHYLIEQAGHDLKLKLMHLEVWTHICLHNLPKESILNKLRDGIKVSGNP